MVSWSDRSTRLRARPVVRGIFTYQLMSFAEIADEESINQTYIEPQVSYNFTSGWYIQCDPAMTYDWTADENDAWDIPVGIDVGQRVPARDHALSLQVGGYDYLKYPDGTPQWIVRAQLTVLFSRILQAWQVSSQCVPGRASFNEPLLQNDDAQ